MAPQGSQERDAESVPDAAAAGAGIPTPTMGAGSAELATTSDDPAVLRELLDRARERLAFYESFDRIIGENIRRSGELMVETVALREQAQAQAATLAAERAAFEASRQADREKHRQLVQGVLSEVAALQPVIEGLVERLQAALAAFGEEEPATSARAEDITVVGEASADAGKEVGAAEAPDAATTEPGEAPVVPQQEPNLEEDAATAAMHDGPRTVEVLAHGIPTAAIAISLQRTLRELEQVASVEAREFADGVLRLQVVASGEIGEADLAEWLARHDGRIASTAGDVVEINVGSAPAT